MNPHPHGGAPGKELQDSLARIRAAAAAQRAADTEKFEQTRRQSAQWLRIHAAIEDWREFRESAAGSVLDEATFLRAWADKWLALAQLFLREGVAHRVHAMPKSAELGIESGRLLLHAALDGIDREDFAAMLAEHIEALRPPPGAAPLGNWWTEFFIHFPNQLTRLLLQTEVGLPRTLGEARSFYAPHRLLARELKLEGKPWYQRIRDKPSRWFGPKASAHHKQGDAACYSIARMLETFAIHGAQWKEDLPLSDALRCRLTAPAPEEKPAEKVRHGPANSPRSPPRSGASPPPARKPAE